MLPCAKIAQRGQPMPTIRRFLQNESGATAIEYGLIAAGLALGIIAAVNGLGTTMSSTFTTVGTYLK
jgi:pilus assembly protein Flp/PilA